MKTPTEKIIEIEKEIEEIEKNKENPKDCILRMNKTILNIDNPNWDGFCYLDNLLQLRNTNKLLDREIEIKEAKLSILKEWEAEDKRKVEEELVFLKRIVQYRDTKDRNDKERFNLINQRIKIFSPQEDKIIESKIQFIKNDIVSLTRLAKKIDEGKC